MARPSKLTPELQDKIVALVRAGNYAETAARAAGISENCHYRWLAWGDDPPRDHGKGAPAPKDNTRYRAYHEAIRQAEAEAEAEVVVHVRKAVPTDWRAGTEFLRRRFPQKWARDKIEVEHTGGVSIDAAAELKQTIEDYKTAFDSITNTPTKDTETE